MNVDVFEGEWKPLGASAKQEWAELTDDDLAEVDGRVAARRAGAIMPARRRAAHGVQVHPTTETLPVPTCGRGGHGRW